jgi:hypothetical protein
MLPGTGRAAASVVGVVVAAVGMAGLLATVV